MDGARLPALRIAQGGAAPPLPHWQSPLFAWALALAYRLVDARPAVGLLAQSLFAVAIAQVLVVVARAVLPPRAVIAVGVCAALYGPLLFFASQLIAAPLDALRRYVASTEGRSTPQRDLAVRALSQMEPLVARLRVVRVPADATVLLDGRGDSPWHSGDVLREGDAEIGEIVCAGTGLALAVLTHAVAVGQALTLRENHRSVRVARSFAPES